jgi:hypothetical protein
MEKLIDILKDKNINLYALHLYLSIVDGLIWKNIFSRVFRIIFQWRKVMWHQMMCHARMLRELTINDL